MIFYYSFPSPENSQASVIPIIVAYLSIQPLLIILFGQLIYRKCCKTKEKTDHSVSADTLSKTTRQLSEIEQQEPLNETSQTGNISIPMTTLDTSSHPKSVEV